MGAADGCVKTPSETVLISELTLEPNGTSSGWYFPLSANAPTFALRYSLTLGDENDQCQVLFHLGDGSYTYLALYGYGMVGYMFLTFGTGNEFVELFPASDAPLNVGATQTNDVILVVSEEALLVVINGREYQTRNTEELLYSGSLGLKVYSPDIEESGTPSCIYRNVELFVPNES